MMCYDLGFETGVLPTFVKNNVINSTKYPNDGSAAIVETLTCKYNEKDYPIGYTANGTENMSLEYQCNN